MQPGTSVDETQELPDLEETAAVVVALHEAQEALRPPHGGPATQSVTVVVETQVYPVFDATGASVIGAEVVVEDDVELVDEDEATGELDDSRPYVVDHEVTLSVRGGKFGVAWHAGADVEDVDAVVELLSVT